MRRFLRLASLLIVSLVTPASLGQTLAKPHFFSVESRNGARSYLFGTIHGGIEISDVPGSVLEALGESNGFLTEWLFSDEEIESVLNGQLVELQLREFKHRGEELNDQERQALVAEWGVDARLASKAKSNDCSLISFGGPISKGFMDFHLIAIAKSKGKHLIQLDSEQKLEELRANNPKCDIRMVMSQMTPMIVRAYQQQLIDKYRSGAPEAEDLADVMLLARNQYWLPKIIGALKQEKIFVTVGVAHLYGAGGLIELLKANGYVVDRIE